MPKLNICIVGLAKDLTDEVCSKLSTELELYYANVQKILEFELFDYENIEKICGSEYLAREEKSVVRRLCTYEDTLINLNYFILNDDDVLKFIKDHCLLIYLHMTYNRFVEENKYSANDNRKTLENLLFEDRDKICSMEADIVVDCKEDNVDEIYKKVSSHIINYYS